MLTAPPLTRNLTDGSLVRVETFRISREKLVAERVEIQFRILRLFLFFREEKRRGEERSIGLIPSVTEGRKRNEAIE